MFSLIFIFAEDLPEYNKNHQVSLTPHTAVILGICGTLFVAILMVVLFIVWRRFCRRKPRLQFWTVELKDDHEQVSFNNMIDYHPDYQNMDASLLIGDMHYQDEPVVENEKGHHKHSTSRYVTLNDRGIHVDA